MLKFSVTTKSGRHEFIYARNYAEAQKIAKQKYGLGCIVQLMSISSNSVVANAMNAVSHTDLEMEYISGANSLVLKKLGEVSSALETYWQSQGSRLVSKALANGSKDVAANIKKAHYKILATLNQVVNKFGEKSVTI